MAKKKTMMIITFVDPNPGKETEKLLRRMAVERLQAKPPAGGKERTT